MLVVNNIVKTISKISDYRLLKRQIFKKKKKKIGIDLVTIDRLRVAHKSLSAPDISIWNIAKYTIAKICQPLDIK